MYPIVEKYHLPITNLTLPVFLNDLDERGLLDTTLVVWMGEFGRTPELNKQTSRDHWPHCHTTLLAGGGVKRGFVYGASDKQGMYPADKPVRPDDLAATVFHLLGIDPKTEVMNHQQRPLPIAEGEVVSGVIA
jgi:arylsulfatase A-like enzyme